MVIRTILDETMISQKELSKKCGVSWQSVSNWMNDVRNPGVFAKRKLMAILRESERQRGKDSDLMNSIVSKDASDKDQFEKMLKGMTSEQVKKIMKAAGKIVR